MGERISEADACHQGRLIDGVPPGACTRFCLRRTKGRSAGRAGEREQESTQSREWHSRKWAARRVEAATHPERVLYAAPSLSTERVTQDLQQRAFWRRGLRGTVAVGRPRCTRAPKSRVQQAGTAEQRKCTPEDIPAPTSHLEGSQLQEIPDQHVRTEHPKECYVCLRSHWMLTHGLG
jgi:hypothetical protein